ncbi:hypothetical protein [Clostridium felsineum]|uniref:hypothetical protein n=1 Tax=Clostridium felsineum TaxID=36839 RepID=UPI00098CBC7A|nr:hypothetical protein [Clostridium felsineum]URZ02548.1 hypothetical protein CLAUR_025600 [Clostridium felsineum]
MDKLRIKNKKLWIVYSFLLLNIKIDAVKRNKVAKTHTIEAEFSVLKFKDPFRSSTLLEESEIGLKLFALGITFIIMRIPKKIAHNKIGA